MPAQRRRVLVEQRLPLARSASDGTLEDVDELGGGQPRLVMLAHLLEWHADPPHAVQEAAHVVVLPVLARVALQCAVHLHHDRAARQVAARVQRRAKQ